jgi:hypothetical protein
MHVTCSDWDEVQRGIEQVSILALRYSVYLYSCCSHLEHRASVKRFVSLPFLNFGQSVGLLGLGISPSQGRYLHRTTQTEQTQTNIHASSGIRSHDPSVRASEDISRPRGLSDRLLFDINDP